MDVGSVVVVRSQALLVHLAAGVVAYEVLAEDEGVTAPAMLAQDYRGVSALTWVILVLSAVFPLYAAFRLWAHALAVLGVAATTRIGVLVPVVAGISSALWTGERFSGAKVASAAVVLAGLALARLGASRSEPPRASG